MSLYMDIHTIDGGVGSTPWPRLTWPIYRPRAGSTFATCATG